MAERPVRTDVVGDLVEVALTYGLTFVDVRDGQASVQLEASVGTSGAPCRAARTEQEATSTPARNDIAGAAMRWFEDGTLLSVRIVAEGKVTDLRRVPGPTSGSSIVRLTGSAICVRAGRSGTLVAVDQFIDPKCIEAGSAVLRDEIVGLVESDDLLIPVRSPVTGIARYCAGAGRHVSLGSTVALIAPDELWFV